MDSQAGSGSVTAPAAGATIASVTVAKAGVYKIKTVASVSNVAVADLGNMKLQVNAVDKLSPIPSGANGQPEEFVLDEVTIGAGQVVAIKAIAVGTAAIEYNATLEVTPYTP